MGETGSVVARPLTGPAVVRPLTGLAIADLISTTGTEMTAVALPWFVLTTTGSPARMGVVLAAEYAGLTLLGLAGARVATYTGPRRLMLSSDLTRAALVAAIPLLHTGPTRCRSRSSWSSACSSAASSRPTSPPASSSWPAWPSDDQVKLTRLGGLLSAVNESASFVRAGPGRRADRRRSARPPCC